jgi:hypothetical protein
MGIRMADSNREGGRSARGNRNSLGAARREAARSESQSSPRRNIASERRAPLPERQTGPRRGNAGTGGPNTGSNYQAPSNNTGNVRTPSQAASEFRAPPQVSGPTPPQTPNQAASRVPSPPQLGNQFSPPTGPSRAPVGSAAPSRAPVGSAAPSAPRPSVRGQVMSSPMLSPRAPNATSPAGRFAGMARAGVAGIGIGAGLTALEYLRGRNGGATPVAAQSENAPMNVTPEYGEGVANRPPARPQTPSRPQARSQARPQAGEMSADRLNEISLALSRGENPQPLNAQDAVAIERIRQRMGSDNGMAMGGMAFGRMPPMPANSAPAAAKASPPRKPTAPKVQKPSVKKPKAPKPSKVAPPKFAKGGAAKKGKK